jgi:hypothetical protein
MAGWPLWVIEGCDESDHHDVPLGDGMHLGYFVFVLRKADALT